MIRTSLIHQGPCPSLPALFTHFHSLYFEESRHQQVFRHLRQKPHRFLLLQIMTVISNLFRSLGLEAFFICLWIKKQNKKLRKRQKVQDHTQHLLWGNVPQTWSGKCDVQIIITIKTRSAAKEPSNELPWPNHKLN